MTALRDRLEYGMIRQIELQQSTYDNEITILNQIPTALELSRLVHSNFPVVIRDPEYTKQIPALNPNSPHFWTKSYLREKLGSTNISVATTPFGDADSPIESTNGAGVFVQPHTVSMPADQLLDSLNNDNNSGDRVVRYMQSQDNNLPTQFGLLASDVPESLKIVNEALAVEAPEAVNLWLGDNRTTSRLHCDQYENFYFQVSGYKAVWLIAPNEVYCLNEKFLTSAHYVPTETGDPTGFDVLVDSDDDGQRCGASKIAESIESLSNSSSSSSTASPKVLFPTVNPSDPKTFTEAYKHCRPYRVLLQPGDLLYLPALWYHQMTILGDEEISVSLNYWYPMNYTAPLWMKWDNLRLQSVLLNGQEDESFFSV